MIEELSKINTIRRYIINSKIRKVSYLAPYPSGNKSVQSFEFYDPHDTTSEKFY